MTVPDPIVSDEACSKCSRSPHQAWCAEGSKLIVARWKREAEKKGSA